MPEDTIQDAYLQGTNEDVESYEDETSAGPMEPAPIIYETTQSETGA